MITLKRLFLITCLFWSGACFSDNPDALTSKTELATFGGGCFWCMEPPFDKLQGVLNTVSGFSGGHVENPSYKRVTRGDTGHAEVVQITFDPNANQLPATAGRFLAQY